jgi:hypothetical protein
VRQPDLFNPAIAPMRRTLYNVRLSLQTIRKDTYPYRSIMDLVKLHEAIVSGDPIQLRMAGITAPMAEEIINRLQTAARAITVQRR